MTNTSRKLKVFLCHASQDKLVVRELYQKLATEDWIDPWLDEEKLLPGHDWNMEIEKAVEVADAVIVCLSKSSVSKEGYIQKEIKKVLDISDQKPEGTIFVIPLRLEDCEPPRRLRVWQYEDYFPIERRDLSYQRLLQSLKIRNFKTSTQPKELATQKKEEKVQKIIFAHNKHDHHTALISEQLSQASSGGVKFLTAKLQWGKDDIGYSLHAEPTSYSSAGMQTTDFLAYLGFKREICPFVPRRECYASWIDSEFELSKFTEKFDQAFGLFEKGSRLLERCAHLLDHLEGWGYFTGKDSSRKSYKSRLGYSENGHTAKKSEKLKQSEDDNFFYQLSWIENTNEKGWVFHYKLKEDANQNLRPVFRFLGLTEFKECPYFGFEECYWMYIQHENRGDSFFESNANLVHGCFDAHKENFSPAMQMLIQANDLLAPFGFHFLTS
jgi:hypothetical protein